MSTDLQPLQVEPTPMSIIAQMVQTGGDPAQLEKMMDLQERWQRNSAAAAFAQALAKFQSICPPIHKGRRADRFSFAGLDDIMAVIRPILAQCGLSVSFDVEHQAESNTINICCITKCGIHEHRTRLACPVPKELKVNSTQQYGAAMSYAKRYALCAALNIVVTDEDVDASNVTSDFITADQVKELHDLLTQTNSNVGAFLQWIGVEELAALPASKYATAKAALLRKVGGK